MKNSTKIEQEQTIESDDNDDDDNNEPVGSFRASPNRIRSESLNPNHSRQFHRRRKSTSDNVSNTMIERLNSPIDTNSMDRSNPMQLEKSSNATKQRRFTLFSFEIPQKTTNPNKRRMTTGRFSLFNEKSNSDILDEKRPRISQMVESFARRFSLRKKKTNQESEQDETVVDPVYETLKVAAETRKMTLANYLQQRQQTLNKQTSLNSQGSSEPDIQPSPRISRQNNRTDTTTNLNPSSTQRQQQQQQQQLTKSSASATPLDNARVTNC